jgi:hypothetical protein
MAFFELLRTAWEDVGTLFKPIAGRGTGGYYPSPQCHAEGADNYGTSPLQMDDAGNAMVRGPVFTDEESFRDDFAGSSLNTALTGTLTFVSGSTDVVGVGTSFTTQLTRENYIKVVAHSETAWCLVADVIDDTHLELCTPYSISTSATSHKTFFPTLTGTNGSFTVTASECRISSGTTNGSRTAIYREGDYGPMVVQADVYVSQRIANQEFFLGCADDPANPVVYAYAIFDGTTNTTIKLRTSSAAGAENAETTIWAMPNGVLSSNTTRIEIGISMGEVTLAINGVRVGSHKRHIPAAYASLSPVAGFLNTGTPASTTTAYVDTLVFQNVNRIEVSHSFMGEFLPMQTREDGHTLTGYVTTTATTANQVICSYTVPTGKYLFVTGYSVASSTSTAKGNPIRVGKGAMTEVVSPGAVDSEVMRTFFLPAASSRNEAFGSPYYLASGGEVVKITVTPDLGTSTTWRASLDFVLR